MSHEFFHYAAPVQEIGLTTIGIALGCAIGEPYRNFCRWVALGVSIIALTLTMLGF